MTKFVQLLVLFNFVYSFSLGQGISSAEIDSLVDKFNCLVIQFSINDGSGSFSCNCKLYPSFEEIKSNIPSDYTKTRVLAEDINKLKNSGISFSSHVDLIEYLCNGVFEDSTYHSKLFSFNRSRLNNKKYLIWKEMLGIELLAIVTNGPTEPKAGAPPGGKNKTLEGPPPPIIKVPVPYPMPPKELFDLKFFLTLFLVIVFVGFLGILLYRIFLVKIERYLKTMIEPEKSYSNDHVDFRISSAASTINQSLAKDFSILREKVVVLERHLLKLEKEKVVEYISADANFPMPRTESVESSIPPTLEPVASNVFYLPNPNNDGSFSDSSTSSSYKEGTSIYEFKKLSSNEASFHIHDHRSSVLLAMMYPKSNILPACDSDNEFHQKFDSLKTIHSGRAVLEGGRWNVKQKARIRYEC